MGFDIENFGLGLVTGWATAYGLYRARKFLGSVRETVSQQAASAQTAATRSADSRYISDLTTLCETTHLAGRAVNLSQILVEPRFIRAPELAAPPDDDVVHDVFYVVPIVPDYPYLHAPYNIETLSIEELDRGDRAIALLGLPGSGRTTALLAIALWSMGKIKFEQPRDKIQEQIEQEEAALPKDQRAARVKERLAIEERARERLREEQGEDNEDSRSGKTTLASVFQRLVPIYVHLANVTLSPGEYGREVDPAEPLVRAAQRQARRITAKTMPRNLYKRLNNGQALVLIDGYDDLPENERRQKLAWLQAFVNEYRRNFIVVAGPAGGYGALTRLGLTPVFLRPWNDLDAAHAADKWADAWPGISGRRRASRPDKKLVEQAKAKNRALSPFELTLKIWAAYAGDAEIDEYEGWLRSYLARCLPQKESPGVLLPKIAQAAALQIDEGFITPSRLQELAIGLSGMSVSSSPEIGTTSGSNNVLSDEDMERVFEDDTGDNSDFEKLLEETNKPARAEKKEPSAKKEEAQIAKEQAQLFKVLQQSGLIVRYRGNRYQFRHVLLADYLASLTLQTAADEQLQAKAANPAWSQSLAFAAMHTSIEPAVNARLSAPGDVLQNHILEIAGRWLPYAGAKAGWRSQILRQLGNMFVAPDQYPLVRERITAALIGTRDKSVSKIFKVALRSPQPDLRRLACLGLGALGEPETVPDLRALLNDPSPDVQLAAGLALGAIGTDEALEEMAAAITEGSERLRQAIAEAFAAIPDEGYPVLFDAIRHEDVLLRRAAVFGLRRVKTTWALVALYRTMLEDKEWYVKSAAQQAFQDMQLGDTSGPRGYPPPEEIPWLRNWVTSLGEEESKGLNAEQALVLALQDNHPGTRGLSAATLGQLGIASKVSELYAALYDEDAAVRAAAFRALGDLQLQIGQPLPALA